MRSLGLLVGLLGLVTILVLGEAPSQETSSNPSLSLTAHSSSTPKVLYRDIAAQAGLTARHVSGSAVDRKFIVESTGSGVGLLDFDRDGFLDLYVARYVKVNPAVICTDRAGRKDY